MRNERIMFFDIYVNEFLVDYVTFERLVKEIGIEEHCVKTLAIVNNFQEALDYDIKFDTTYGPSTSASNTNMCEGIVIKQFQLFSETSKHLLLCKRNNTGFLESKPVEKEAKKVEISDYINKNRIESYLSKMMDIDKLSETDLEAIIKDALKDILIDYPDYVLEEKVNRVCCAKIQGVFKALKQ